ncbi:MAG: MFS transporter [Halofilum sp. (in: g-proteobacteria)]|nr:MFS transporter [Halofilum sp. (in: g-proteobacteria)]
MLHSPLCKRSPKWPTRPQNRNQPRKPRPGSRPASSCACSSRSRPATTCPYLFRSVNAVTAPNLVADTGITADELGFLTATYMGAFALLQLPLGIALDRFGPRRVEAVLLTLAAAGSLAFALAEDLAGLSSGAR